MDRNSVLPGGGGGEFPRGGLTSLLVPPDYPDPDPECSPRSHAIMAMSTKSVHAQADAEPPYEFTVRARGHVVDEHVGCFPLPTFKIYLKTEGALGRSGR